MDHGHHSEKDHEGRGGTENQIDHHAAHGRHDHRKEEHAPGADHDKRSHHGHAHHHGDGSSMHDHGGMIKDFKKRLWVSLAATLPVLMLSPMIQSFFNYQLTFPGNQYLVFALSTAIYFYGGWPFLSGAVGELRSRAPGMMTLIALAISVAYFYSGATVFGLTGMDFFWELATLIDVMLLGHWLEMKSVAGASRALELLVSMLPAQAHRVSGETVEDVALEEIQESDALLVKPGEKIPVDGVVTDGDSHVNESMLTGESTPVRKTADMKVIGGSINGNGSLKIVVEHTGKESYLSKVIDLVQRAQQEKSKMQNLSDRAAKWLTYIALTVGFSTLAAWLLAGFPFVYALERMVTVMVITCPHALGLAIPLVVAISTSVSAQNGLLIRNRTAFEESRKVTAIIFDKTGTLTQGTFGVTRVRSLQSSLEEVDILRLAGALERQSEHPIAHGIVTRAESEGVNLPEAKDFKSLTGKGVKAVVEGKEISVVGPGYLKEHSMEVPDSSQDNEAETVVYVCVGDQVAGFISLADSIREESLEAIATLKKNSIRTIMATGDNEAVARSVARKLSLDGYHSGLQPHEKVEIVKQLQKEGEYVAMTGDGVNDAPALAQANVGIAVGSGTDVAAETADIILVNSNPKDIANLILFGKATYRKMIQNLTWATAYNALAIPLAAGVLYSSGFVLSPAVGAVCMSLSTIIVAANAQLLKKSMLR